MKMATEAAKDVPERGGEMWDAWETVRRTWGGKQRGVGGGRGCHVCCQASPARVCLAEPDLCKGVRDCDGRGKEMSVQVAVKAGLGMRASTLLLEKAAARAIHVRDFK